MANHVDTVSDVWVPALSVADFKAQLQHGDALMFAGNGAISRAIQGETKSPWSHIGTVIFTPFYPEPLFLEAVFPQGVIFSRLYDKYLGVYDGDIVLCRRVLPKEGIDAIIAKGISRIGCGYDWQSEVEQAAHKLFGFLPEHATEGELYCSGEFWYMSTAWTPPIHRPNLKVMPSPEDIWTDPTVIPNCKLLKGAK
jgi:hypothetical protein